MKKIAPFAKFAAFVASLLLITTLFTGCLDEAKTEAELLKEDAVKAFDNLKEEVNDVSDKITETKDKIEETAEDITEAKDAVQEVFE